MGCDESRLQISSWEDAELEAQSEAALFAHLATCDECRLFSRRVRKLRRMLAGGRVAGHIDAEGGRSRAYPERKAVLFGPVLILVAFFISVVSAVVLLTSPPNAEPIPEKNPIAILHSPFTPGQLTDGNRQ